MNLNGHISHMAAKSQKGKGNIPKTDKILQNQHLREWINTLVGIALLAVAFFGVIQVTELTVNLNDINASLNELSANTLRIQELKLLNSNGEVAGVIHHNDTALIISTVDSDFDK